MDAQTETVTAFFQNDHRRLDTLYERYQEARANRPEEAPALLGDFQQGLRQHIAWEEEHLFPLFEEHTGMQLAGPTEVMRQEHREIERVLGYMDEALAAGRPEGLPDLEEQLQDRLGLHNAKEEQVLYPGIDGLLDSGARAELFTRIRG
ncbi:hypothetical protein AN478_05070 [Thiohalorhabdus denitrificans]|uniref:Hemerythrin HHE cation binding domain-containing protein n=1 Tax=Thiohalorhabdus denitrificans TaxID=381306 RepID=A0A0P9C6U3_9GAMM|nr:hemerythrin domain-containing protein [Thiohalorhabdus denitrificans]KPV40559.1 hypothetical protein AN478_05070 [Thiohalorhabdus denitrificans]SCY51391.1 Hemerythrin HHE cation binding domain-containing protein [Thiohalorhabdus denitrificans]